MYTNVQEIRIWPPVLKLDFLEIFKKKFTKGFQSEISISTANLLSDPCEKLSMYMTQFNHPLKKSFINKS